jgi:tyrosyl-tRNA synthetase
MQAYGLEPQVAMTVPLLLSWDGEKMSGSKGNYIGLDEAPEEQFGKTMRIPDELLPDWYRLVYRREYDGGDPMEAKLDLARFIVARSHGDEAAARAEEHFARVVRRGEAPEDVPEAAVPEGELIHLPRLLADLGLASSTSDARRLIGQGAVRIDDVAVSELDVPRERLLGSLVQAGKRKFMRFQAT